jgi:hypothetical protein
MSYQAAVGQLELIGKGSAFTSRANAGLHSEVFLLIEKYVGLHGSLVRQPTVCLMGFQEQPCFADGTAAWGTHRRYDDRHFYARSWQQSLYVCGC